MSDTRTGEVGHPRDPGLDPGLNLGLDLGLSAYGQDDPADVPGGVGYALSMVEVARYWNRRSAGAGRPDLDAEVAEAREARRLAEILGALGEISSPLAPLEVLEVGATSTWTAAALGRLGFRVESADGPDVRSPHLFDLVLATGACEPDAVAHLASLVRLGGRLLVAGPADALRPVLEPRGFRLPTDPDDTEIDTRPGALLAWTRES